MPGVIPISGSTTGTTTTTTGTSSGSISGGVSGNSTLSPSTSGPVITDIPTFSGPSLGPPLLDYLSELGTSFLQELESSKNVDLTNSIFSMASRLVLLSMLSVTDQQLTQIEQDFTTVSTEVSSTKQPTTQLSTDAATITTDGGNYDTAQTDFAQAESDYTTALGNYTAAVDAFNNGTITETQYDQAALAYQSATTEYTTATTNLTAAASKYNTAIDKYNTDLQTYLTAVGKANAEITKLNANRPANDQLPLIDTSGLPTAAQLDADKITLPTIPTVPNPTIPPSDLTGPDFTSFIIPTRQPLPSTLVPTGNFTIAFTQFITPWLTTAATANTFGQTQHKTQKTKDDHTEEFSIVLLKKGNPSNDDPGEANKNYNSFSTATPSPQAAFLTTVVSGLSSSQASSQISSDSLTAALNAVFGNVPPALLARLQILLTGLFSGASIAGITPTLGLQSQTSATAEPSSHTAAMALALGPAIYLIGAAASPELENAIQNTLYLSQDFSLLTAAQQNTLVNLLTTATGLTLLSTAGGLIGSSASAPSLLVNALIVGISTDLAEGSNTQISTALDALRTSATPAQLSTIQTNLGVGFSETLVQLGVSATQASAAATAIAQEATNPAAGTNFNDFVTQELQQVLPPNQQSQISAIQQNFTSSTFLAFLGSNSTTPVTPVNLSSTSVTSLQTQITSQITTELEQNGVNQASATTLAQQIAGTLSSQLQSYANSPTSLETFMSSLSTTIQGDLSSVVSLSTAQQLSSDFIISGFTSLASVEMNQAYTGESDKTTGQAVTDSVTSTTTKKNNLTRDYVKRAVDSGNQAVVNNAFGSVTTDASTSPGTLALTEPSKTFSNYGLMYEGTRADHHKDIDVRV